GKGLRHDDPRQRDQLGAQRLDVADDVRPCLLRGGDDACGRRALRPRPLWRRVPPEPAAVGRDDRRRHAVQQDGAGAAQGVRPDGGAALGDIDGLLRQRRRLLPLFVLGRARLRPHRARRHLCARMPADGRGAALRHHPAPEQDLAHEHDRPLMSAAAMNKLTAALAAAFNEGSLKRTTVAFGEVTVVVDADRYLDVMRTLRDRPELRFEMLIDLCGVDYSSFGGDVREGPRFAAVSHLLSLSNNWRLRVRAFAPDDDFPVIPSLVDVWPSVNWFEREAFDLYGIMFPGHPDLRRLLTDYGFVGHPFRKDF